MRPSHSRPITIIALTCAAVASVVTSVGIFSSGGPGPTEHISVHGQKILLHGEGVYRHMSADVAVQGIAQDWVTLCVGVPLLLLSLMMFRKNSLRGAVLLAGTSLYFLVTYLLYLNMAMFNPLFLGYVVLLACAFFLVSLVMIPLARRAWTGLIPAVLGRKAGLFMMVNAGLVALLWLGTILPPLLNGSLYPEQLQHYTTLVVQGMDLALFLPTGFVCGLLAFRRNPVGVLFTTVYLVFLSLLMLALISKIAFMGIAGANIIPVVFIMPTIFLISLTFAILLVRETTFSERNT